MKRIGLIILCLAVISSPAAAQRDGTFRSALQRGNTADPELLPFLAEQFKPLAQSMLPGHTVTAVTINQTTGAVLVTAKDGDGKVVTLNGSDVKGGSGGDAVFGWIRCAWDWFTSLGSKKCTTTTASTPVGDVPVNYNRQQERQKNAAFLDMYGG